MMSSVGYRVASRCSVAMRHSATVGSQSSPARHRSSKSVPAAALKLTSQSEMASLSVGSSVGSEAYSLCCLLPEVCAGLTPEGKDSA